MVAKKKNWGRRPDKKIKPFWAEENIKATAEHQR
jgi:hypothetical protein